MAQIQVLSYPEAPAPAVKELPRPSTTMSVPVRACRRCAMSGGGWRAALSLAAAAEAAALIWSNCPCDSGSLSPRVKAKGTETARTTVLTTIRMTAHQGGFSKPRAMRAKVRDALPDPRPDGPHGRTDRRREWDFVPTRKQAAEPQGRARYGRARADPRAAADFRGCG